MYDAIFYQFEVEERGLLRSPASKPQTAAPAQKTCPKCGKAVGRGRYVHEKYCKGPKL